MSDHPLPRPEDATTPEAQGGRDSQAPAWARPEQAVPSAPLPTPPTPPTPPESFQDVPRLRPLGIGEILDGAVKIWRTDVRRLFMWVALFSLPSTVLVALITPTKVATTETGGLQTDAVVNASSSREAVGGAVIALLITLVTNFIITASLTAYLTDRVLNRPADLRACLRVGWSRMLPLLGSALLVGVLLVPVCVLSILVFPPLGLVVVVGAIYLFIRWYFTSQIVVIERAGPRQALKRSFFLTTKQFWRIVGIIVLTGLITSMVSLVITSILQAVVLRNETGGSAGAVLARTFTGLVAAGLTMPFGAAVSVITYLDLRVRKEGLDVQLLTKGLTAIP